MRLSAFWYELVLDLIAGGVFVGAWAYYRVTRPRLAVAPGGRAYPAAYTPIATGDAYPVYAGMCDTRAGAGDGRSDADGPDALSADEPVCEKIIHRVPVRFTGELARLAEPAALRAMPRFCFECLQEVRQVFPTIEAVGLPRRCARHRIKFDDWIRVGGVNLRRHHLVLRGREIQN